VSVIVFRYRKPDAPRTFRLPLMPLVPAFGVVSSGFLMLQLHWETWLRFIVWLVIGLVIYFGYGRRHSLMNPDSPRHAEAVEMHRSVG
jgi:basic amino acid/polyamine antiporter, APA family